MLIQIVGSSCIGIGCMGIGYAALFDLRRRLHQLEYMKKLCMQVESEIRYYHASIPDICFRMAKTAQNPYSDFFVEVFERMEKNDGMSFYKVWEEECRKLRKKVPVREEEFELFQSFFVRGMQSDLLLQQEAIHCQIESFDEKIQGMKEEVVSKGKVYTSLGVLSGLLLIIILI